MNINEIKEFVKNGNYHKFDSMAQGPFFKGYKQAFREEKIRHRLKNNFLSKPTYKFLEDNTPEKFREYSYIREMNKCDAFEKGYQLGKSDAKKYFE